MFRQEIGSEFWDIPQNKSNNNLFPQKVQWFASGRTALSVVVREIRSLHGVRSVAVPSWCCHSMIEPLVRHGLEIHAYPVYLDRNGRLVQNLSNISGCDAVLLMEYFGYSQSVQSIKFDGIVIRDVTHSLFEGIPEDADYVFGSLRKWAGICTGGFAWKKDGTLFGVSPDKTNAEYVSLRQRAMEEKRQYIQGVREDKGYLKLFAQAEDLLDAQAVICDARPEDVAAAHCLNEEYLRCRRRENAAVLLKTVREMALFPELKERDCPMFVPILVPDGKRDALRRFLIQQEIYCPIHWPITELHQLDEQTRRIYDEELSLVCDQRYGVADMERICKAVKDFFEGRRT